jgi:acyl-CoA synthetase (AMP-forming)/AMP-acid ligase II
VSASPQRNEQLRVGDVVRLHAANPALRDRVAVSCGPARRTWGQLRVQSESLARGLAGDGLGRHDVVALYMHNRLEYVEVIYGLALLGVALLPLSPRWVQPEVVDALRACGASAIVTDPGGAAVARGAGAEAGLDRGRVLEVGGSYEDVLARGAQDGRELPGPDEADTFRLAYTSGTTGRPKVCVVPHRATVQSWMEQSIAFGIGSGDVELAIGPLFHGLGFSCVLQQLYAGGAVRILERFDAARALAEIAEERPTVLRGVPMLYDRLLAALGGGRHDVSSLRYVMTSGAPMPAVTKRALIRAFPSAAVVEFLASTEAGLFTANWLGADDRTLDSCGRPFFRTEIQIRDAQGRVLPAGEVGEICKRGLLQGPAYLGDPERTAEGFFGAWFRSGDLGYQDADGYVYVVGRTKDVIVSGGINVYPGEIEAVIHELDEVAEVAVVGVPDAVWGEAVKAVVVPNAGRDVSPAAVDAACRARLAGYKRPRVIELAGELPRTASGKVLKRDLQERRGYELAGEGWRPVPAATPAAAPRRSGTRSSPARE